MSKLPIGASFGSFLIVKHIGGGGMAQIYLVKTKGLAGFEKYLALKIINPEYANEERFVQMLIDEAKIQDDVGWPQVPMHKSPAVHMGQCSCDLQEPTTLQQGPRNLREGSSFAQRNRMRMDREMAEGNRLEAVLVHFPRPSVPTLPPAPPGGVIRPAGRH